MRIYSLIQMSCLFNWPLIDIISDYDLFPVSENMSLLLLLMVFIPGLGSNLENLRIVDSLLKQYDRRATPTTNTGIPIKTAVQYYCISWVDKYSWKVSIPCSWIEKFRPLYPSTLMSRLTLTTEIYPFVTSHAIRSNCAKARQVPARHHIGGHPSTE